MDKIKSKIFVILFTLWMIEPRGSTSQQKLVDVLAIERIWTFTISMYITWVPLISLSSQNPQCPALHARLTHFEYNVSKLFCQLLQRVWTIRIAIKTAWYRVYNQILWCKKRGRRYQMNQSLRSLLPGSFKIINTHTLPCIIPIQVLHVNL